MELAELEKRCSQVGLLETFSRQDLHTYQQDLSYLFKTRLMYSIVGFQNTTLEGRVTHAIRRDDDGLSIKVQGVYQRVRDIRENYRYDRGEHHLYHDESPWEHWNYFSPDGLVPIDRYVHHETSPTQPHDLEPIEQLNQTELDHLRAHAALFHGLDAHPNPSEPCVIQLVTNPRGIQTHGLRKTWSTQYPVHAYIRIIDAEGKVYSTGFGSTLDEDEYNEGLSRYLASINGQPTNMDYEEMRQHEGRIVTSIPTSKEATQTLLETLGVYRQHTARFNLVKQNCLTLAAHSVKIGTGVDLEIDVPIHRVVGRAVGVRKLPKIAPAWEPERQREIDLKKEKKSRAAKVSRVAIGILTVGLSEVYRWARGKVYVALVRGLGASKGSPLPKGALPPEEQEKLEDFFSLLPKPTILGSGEEPRLYHSYPLIQWQLAQASTYVQAYTGVPKMGLYPPLDDEECAEGRALRIKLHKAFCVLEPHSWPDQRS